MKKIILILAAMLTFAACTKEGDVIYQTDPADAPSTTPRETLSAEAAAAQPRRNPFCGRIAMECRQDMIANIIYK